MRELKLSYTEDFRNSFGKDFSILEELINHALENSYELDPIDTSLEVEFDSVKNKFVIENMHGVHGLTRNSERIEFDLSSEPEDWEEYFKSQFAHEYAHTIFMSYENLKYESNIENWKHILLEAHGQHFAKKAYPEINPEWRTKFSKKEIEEKWPEIREKLNTKIFTESIFNSEELHPWFGYSIAYYIGQELLQDNDLNTLPKLEKEDVINSGDKTFL